VLALSLNLIGISLAYCSETGINMECPVDHAGGGRFSTCLSLIPPLSVPDANNTPDIELYSRLLLFTKDSSQQYIDFENPQHSEQRTLQSLAHKLEFDFEYSKASRIARISRPEVPAHQPDLDLVPPIGLFSHRPMGTPVGLWDVL
jgi:hypothetical protein